MDRIFSEKRRRIHQTVAGVEPAYCPASDIERHCQRFIFETTPLNGPIKRGKTCRAPTSPHRHSNETAIANRADVILKADQHVDLALIVARYCCNTVRRR
ncbi:hypothetical protein PQR02_34690 [Paraburkholderia sediminicola]|uniref:Uncharacterized protein n=1 Tax=Paraburkholderia rhynchosiae TaxID=487049 RepID=A0ACC7NP69_9BURK